MQQIIAYASQHGVIRPRDLIALGIDPTHLRRLVKEGVMIRAGRGLYTLADYDVTEFHSLVEAVQAQSKGVICLLSALSFYGIGTQIPHQVWVSIPYGARISTTSVVPMRIVVARPPAYGAEINIHRLEGVDVPIYSVAKTVADCFKFRNKVGLDVAIEALRERRCSREDIRNGARIDRVERVIRPYMEALSA
jgi:predicted transcriptional regulator of viral defense system